MSSEQKNKILNLIDLIKKESYLFCENDDQTIAVIGSTINNAARDLKVLIDRIKD